MTKQEKLLKLSEIEFREDVYPRLATDWVTTQRYVNALNSNAEFPPIVVALFKKKNILVDGKHRLEAFKQNKEKYIKTEVLTGLTLSQIFQEAVKRNAIHGRQFSTQETTQIIVKLRELNLDDIKISEMVNIPVDKLTKFVADRITRIVGTKGDVALKKPFRHLANEDYDGQLNQKLYVGTSQHHKVDEIIKLINAGLMDFKNKVVNRKLKKLWKILCKIYA